MQELLENLKEVLRAVTGQPDVSLTVPGDLTHGDLTSNVAMRLAADEKRPPLETAHALVERMRAVLPEQFSRSGMSWGPDDVRVEAAAPGFINFFFSDKVLLAELKQILSDDNYGRSDSGSGQTFVVEYSSPNTNKPLHVGHLRNNALGMALARLYEFFGHRVIKTEVVNDRGVHIMKSLWAYQQWGKGTTPQTAGCKGDKLVGDYYVKYNEAEKADPQIKAEPQRLLQRWEENDPAVRQLWQQLNQWVYEAWAETYLRYGSQFDVHYYESQLYDKGKEIILSAERNGLAKKQADGSVVIDLSQYGLGGRDSGEKVLLRPDGTTVYITQDIYLAKQRYDDYQFARMIYVVGDEQLYHFRVLFKILELLGFEFFDRCVHYSYGQVNLPEGKMKSREGKVVDADDLLNELTVLADYEVTKRNADLSKAERGEIAERIAVAAIKYWFLRSNPKSLITFDPRESLDFEGNTGPYLLYTYVRLLRIIEKAGAAPTSALTGIGETERMLLRQLVLWPQIIRSAYEQGLPSVVAEYLYALSSRLNAYYQQVPVLKAAPADRPMRLAMVMAGSRILRLGLYVLNIETVTKM